MTENREEITHKVKEFFTSYPLRAYSKKEIIMHPGTSLPGVFYLIEGRVSQYDVASSGAEVVVNVYKPGAFFPMSAAINTIPNHYFFEASTKVAVHIAPVSDAVLFLKDNPDVLFDLLARVYRGTDGVLRRMAHLMGGDAKSRLLFELLNAAYRFGEPTGDGAAIFVALKEHDIARHAGLARETVNRTVQNLKKAGLIEVNHHGVTLKDVRQLEDILGSDL